MFYAETGTEPERTGFGTGTVKNDQNRNKMETCTFFKVRTGTEPVALNF